MLNREGGAFKSGTMTETNIEMYNIMSLWYLFGFYNLIEGNTVSADWSALYYNFSFSSLRDPILYKNREPHCWLSF